MVRDLAGGLARHEIWRAFAWDEIQQRYQRSVLGLLWIALSYLAFVLAIGLFFGGFARIDAESFVVYVAFGYASFTFWVGNLTDGCAVFTSSASWIKSAQLPYSIYVFKSVSRSSFTLLVQSLTAIALVTVFFAWRPSLHGLLIVPACIAFIVNAVWVQYLLGFASARWGDVHHVVTTLQRLLFFTTPILWVYEERSPLIRRLADINPLTHLIEVFRAPLMGQVPDAVSVLFVLGFTATGWALTVIVGGLMKPRLPFWV